MHQPPAPVTIGTPSVVHRALLPVVVLAVVGGWLGAADAVEPDDAWLAKAGSISTERVFAMNGTQWKLMMNQLVAMAAASPLRSANGSHPYSETKAVYGLVQCRMDLAPDECRDCLNFLVGEVTRNVPNNTAGNVWAPKCYFRYDHDPIYVNNWEQCVLHRDIKPSNVMLDASFNAKLGDFGLVRLVDHGRGSHTTELAGTTGYMDPQCTVTGRFSTESDIYSFGVLLLAVASGRRPVVVLRDGDAFIHLARWIWDLHGRGMILAAADPRLNGEFEAGEMESLLVAGLWCVHPDWSLRPSIRRVVSVLRFEAPPPSLAELMPGYMPATAIRLDFAAATSSLAPNNNSSASSSSRSPAAAARRGSILDATDVRVAGEFDAREMACTMRPTIRQADNGLRFEAPPPILPTKMPVASYGPPANHPRSTISSEESATVSCRGHGSDGDVGHYRPSTSEPAY
nr:unnamed protein product [Digitaria exilis]